MSLNTCPTRVERVGQTVFVLTTHRYGESHEGGKVQVQRVTHILATQQCQKLTTINFWNYLIFFMA